MHSETYPWPSERQEKAARALRQSATNIQLLASGPRDYIFLDRMERAAEEGLMEACHVTRYDEPAVWALKEGVSALWRMAHTRDFISMNFRFNGIEDHARHILRKFSDFNFAWESGHRAGLRGSGKFNPYGPDDVRHSYYNRGWYEGNRERIGFPKGRKI
jgi:ribosome modulation factor